MAEFIGICNTINWEELVKTIEVREPEYTGPRHRIGDPVIGVDQVIGNLKEAGHRTIEDNGSARWDMFIAGKQFDEDIAYKFANWVNLDSYTSCWISRILPGHMAPWHWDITDDEKTLNKREIVRYHCHLGNPDPAHVLVVNDQCLHLQKPGSVYKWSSRTAWHCGLNGGLKPKYLFNFWH